MNLFIFGLLAALAAALAWRYARGSSLRDRRQIEDALKHLFDQEYRGRHASLPSLSGALRLSDRRVLALVARMQSQRLVVARGQEFDLTPEGERLALQIVRAHRLLERYFADEARLPLGKVHAAAERGEHLLSSEQVERLSAAMGHPTFDPHGDPIPSRQGSVAPLSGVSATSWPLETTGRIVHLEDEPQIAFAQILAAGLRVGQLLRVLETSRERVVLTDGENEFSLAPAVAANVFLAPAPESAVEPGTIRLSELPQNQAAVVIALDDACQGFSRRRLMDLGFTEGAHIRPVLNTFAGDPRGYEVRGTLVAVRRDQAAQIFVKPVEQDAQGAA
ncbi:MAG: FeoA domain-containing protein [Pseudomonadota bacterium]|nr:FeoA domain-containing protein [Pseudomonadota bacterium]